MSTKKVLSKCKFDEGERVLCYEPDLAKTKVLYDSKILKLIPEKDEYGRKFFKYLIHFQGWNSTWDRCVTDEFVLKDTEENRKLQKKLAEEAQLTPGGHLYRKDRKKKIKFEPKPIIVEPAIEPATDPIDKSMVEEENEPVVIPNYPILLPKKRLPKLDIPENLLFYLGSNCLLGHDTNTIVRLPCQPNVVTLLENYLKYSARNNFSDNKTIKKSSRQRHQPEVIDTKELEKRYAICVEILDGLRICFNTFLFRRLLNKSEHNQYQEALKMPLKPPQNNIPQNGEQEYNNLSNGEKIENHDHEIKNCGENKRENMRSSNSQCDYSQRTCSDCSLKKSQCSKIVQDMFEKVRDEYVSKADSWKAVPDSAYDEEIKQPAIIYGANHLLRLFEYLPIIIGDTEADDEKISVIYSYSNGLLKYLSTQVHLFEKQYYMKNDVAETTIPSTQTRNHKNHKNN